MARRTAWWALCRAGWRVMFQPPPRVLPRYHARCSGWGADARREHQVGNVMLQHNVRYVNTWELAWGPPGGNRYRTTNDNTAYARQLMRLNGGTTNGLPVLTSPGRTVVTSIPATAQTIWEVAGLTQPGGGAGGVGGMATQPFNVKMSGVQRGWQRHPVNQVALAPGNG